METFFAEEEEVDGYDHLRTCPFNGHFCYCPKGDCPAEWKQAVIFNAVG